MHMTIWASATVASIAPVLVIARPRRRPLAATTLRHVVRSTKSRIRCHLQQAETTDDVHIALSRHRHLPRFDCKVRDKEYRGIREEVGGSAQDENNGYLET